MKKRLFSIALALCLCISLMPNAFALEEQPAGDVPAITEAVWSDAEPVAVEEAPPEPAAESSVQLFAAERAGETFPTYAQAYEQMIALKSKYPEGMTWTNFEPYGSKGDRGENYKFKGGAIKGAQYGVGCAAFCFILSDELFGTLPAYVYDRGNFTFDDIHVSDFLRVDNNSHFVTVLQITSSGVILAEGNYNKSVHWGRAISRDQLMSSITFMVTRYPKSYSESDTPETTVAEGTEPGKSGNTLNWKISSKGTLTLTGTGAMKDYDRNDGEKPTWENQNNPIYSVDIGSGITSVGASAFFQKKDLFSVSLPDTITSIGINAFRGSNIIGISIPGSVKSVGNDAFRECSSLASIDIGDGVETIGERAFHSCTALGYVDLPGSLTKLGAGAFTSCENLEQVRFMPSKGTLTFGANAFTQCWRLTFVSLPEGITELPPGLFLSCNMIAYIYIPSTINTLGEADKDSPFLNSTVGTVYFGGTQAKWNSLMNAIRVGALIPTYLMLDGATVVCEQSDPFVPDANDPGDIRFCENGKHAGPVDDDGTCQNCGEKAHEHIWAESWSDNGEYHWHECTADNCTISENNLKNSYGAHEYDNDADTTCNTCNHIRTVAHTHTWAQTWSSNDEYHWHECETPNCGINLNDEKDGYNTHTYDNDSDTTCNVCGHTRTVSGSNPIDPTPEHTHEWSDNWNSDGTHHWHECKTPNCPTTDNSQKDGYDTHSTGTTCTICGHIQHEVHNWSPNWNSNSTHHWHECELPNCPINTDSHKDGYAPHKYDNDADATCNTCSHTRVIAHTHEWSHSWENNETHHWHNCTVPNCDITETSQKNSYTVHIYDDDTDTTCNTCGYIRTISGGDTPGTDPVGHTHTWASEWQKDEDCHWHDCTAPGCTLTDHSKKDGYALHNYGLNGTGDTCSTCGYKRDTIGGDEPNPDHTHTWASEWQKNEDCHWHDCTASDCTLTDHSKKDGYALHNYGSDGTGDTCSTCGYKRNTGGDTPGTDPAEHTHSWADTWSSNTTHHWHDCTAEGCTVSTDSDKNGYAAHVYDNSSDTTCNTCGYIRTVSSGGSSSGGGGGGGSSSSRPSSSSSNTTKNPDGSTTTKTENKTTGTVTETTKNPDGSQTVVETKKDGTVTTTAMDASGNKTETVANPDGSSTTTVEQKDGMTASISTSASGQTEAEVTIPTAAASEARQSGEAITLPIQSVRAAQNSASASSVTVKTGSAEAVKVEIPTANVTPGTVAMLVHADGSEEVLKTTLPTEHGITVPLSDGATVKVVDNSKNFADVSADYWANDAIRFTSARELFAGTSDTTFTPNAPMTRAMLMTVLARHAGEDTTGSPYEKGMAWAVANGISDGSNASASITREQLVTMLWRYSGSPAASGSLDTFTDAGAINGYAQDAMRWAIEKGIISGYENGQVNPQGLATRAAVAAIIMRFSTNV